MKKPKLLTATFKESLNLKKDDFIKLMVDETISPSFVFSLPFTIVIIAINYGVYYMSQQTLKSEHADSLIKKTTINFLPEWLFYGFLLFFVIFWLYSHFFIKRNASNNTAWVWGNANYLLLWIGIESVLFLTTILYQFYPLWMWLLMFTLTILLIFVTTKQSINNIKNLVFGTKIYYSNKRIIKVIQLIIFIIVLYLIISLIFPNVAKNQNIPLEIIGVTSSIPLAVIGITCLESYMLFPFTLYYYYKTKYPEEYRKFEGKKQIEWYGYKYYKKYIKGTELDEDKK